MGRPKAAPWSTDELTILRRDYPTGGYQAVILALPHRTWRAVYVMASRLGLRSAVAAPARKLTLRGESLKRAVVLRETDGWSYARIGAEFGVCETAASNAIQSALCARLGHRPAERDATGRLVPTEIERMRYMLKKGLRGIEIQRRMAVSAGTVSEQRRRYNAELQARGKALLPPPGNGERYCGAKLTPETKREIERLLLTGMGCPKVSDATGAGKTQVVRIRALLVARLKRRGEALPGCDVDGKRVQVFGSKGFIPEETKDRFRRLILARMSVQRAAKQCGIGGCSAYRLRDGLKAEFAARGETLPPPILLGRMKESARSALKQEAVRPEHKFRLRRLIHELGDEAGRAVLARQLRAEAPVRSSFENQLARVAAGARLVSTFRPSKPLPDMTLGGVSSGAL